ncbi:MAG: tetratricopeptide repeat protein [Bacteroidota bacterium]|nr:tetratricopeptide repeat protein [Bacteroidota bacterium]
MRQLLITLFILNLLNIKSQNFDSLRVEANKLSSDTAKINLFYNEGFSNRAINVQYSYDCAKEAERLAQKISLPFYTAKASNLLGILYYRKGDLNSALSYYKNALSLRILIDDKKGIAQCESNIGNVYSDIAQYSLAEEFYLKALAISNDLNLSKQMDNCLLNLGVLNVELKNITVAENYFNQALKNSKKRFDYEMESSCLNNLAEINTIKKDYDAAIANCLNSIKLKNLMDNEMEMADSYLTIAFAFIKKNDAAAALENLKIADSIIYKFNYLPAKIEALKIYSLYYELVKNYQEAFGFLNKSLALQDSLEIVNKEINLENNFSEASLKEIDNEGNKNEFPILYFNLLIIVLLACAVFIFKNKR